MTKLQINLSSRPFVNYTIYHLGYVVIGLAGLLLLAHNALWFFSNHGDVRLMEQEITALQSEVDSNIRQATVLAEEIEAIQRNRRFREVVSFVDGRIRQRRFSWIRMLNLLQEAIPADVKIESITPRVQQNSIRIMLACIARKEEAVNLFIENLEGIDDFDRVLITSEDREGSTISFPLTMEYSPLEFSGDRRPAGEIEAVLVPEGEQGSAAAPEPGSLAEAVSLARLPDPAAADDDFPEIQSAPDGAISDPFAIGGDDPFAGGGDMFGEPGGFGGEGLTSPETPPEPPVRAPPPKTGTTRKKSTGDLIKRPPRKPGDKRNRVRPPGQPGGSS